ncbi:MAG TPA: TetR/AcrR family transcriptional regulator [Lachnospiraceae bacterium]|jgi:AcrR family transcriptional regulator|nr:TetR/AcrR family transcriptional regulator [Lachnospiraceae bacterium]
MDKQLRGQIIDAAIGMYARQGLKFTMQDIANEMHISKKTIYTEFTSKEELLLAVVDDGFANIYREKAAVIRDGSLSPREKLKKVMIAMPDEYRLIDFGRMDGLKEKYPEVYDQVRMYLQTGWEPTLRLIAEGKRDGWIRESANIGILQTMFTASIEAFIRGDSAGESYTEALNDMMDILLDGITV